MEVIRELGFLPNPNLRGALIKQIIDGKDNVREFALSTLINLYRNDQDLIIQTLDHFLGVIKKGNTLNTREEKASIDAIGSISRDIDISDDRLDESFQILLDKIQNNHVLKKEALISLNKFIYKMHVEKLKDLVDTLLEPGEEENGVNELIIATLNIINEMPKISKIEINAFKAFFSKDIEGKITAYNEYNHERRDDLIDHLSSKYAIANLAEVTREDKVEIENHQEVILFRALESSNIIARQMLFNLLAKINCNTHKILAVVDYKLESTTKHEDKIKIITAIKGNFALVDEGLEILLKDRLSYLESKLTLKTEFPDMDSIFYNLEHFVNYVDNNKIGVQITTEELIVGGEKYPLGHGKDMVLKLTNARELYQALIKHQNIKDTILSTKRIDIFTEFTGTYIEGDEVQLTVLRKTTDRTTPSGKPSANIIVVFEENTIFGYSLIRKYYIEDGKALVSYFKSSDRDYRQSIFGNPGEGYSYEIKSITTDREIYNSLLQEMLNCKKSEEMYKLVVNAIKQENLSQSIHVITDSVITQNQLLGTTDIEEQILALQHDNERIKAKLSELEVKVKDLTKDFKDFKISQQSIMTP
jgi:hypothetical protein